MRVDDMTEDEISRLLFVSDEPKSAGLAIVFGHNDRAVSECRVRKAVRLYDDGFVPKLVLTRPA